MSMLSNKEKMDPELSPDNKPVNPTFISVLVTTFLTVFIAELGDKTQITIFLLSAQSGKPVVVFFGAAIALIFTSLVGVLLGRWIAMKMPSETIEYAAGLLMILIGLWLGIQASGSMLSEFSL